MESPILIDIWTVDPARRDELVERVSKAIREIISQQPGFVSAQVYESLHGRFVLLLIRMRTPEDRQHLEDLPAAQNLYREVRAIGKTHANLYRLVESVGEPG